MDELGSPISRNHYASGWAWAMCTPFRWQKLIGSDYGGTTNPLIVSWPARIKDNGGLRSQFAHVNGIAATIYESVGIEFPTVVDGVEQVPLAGASFVDSFDDAAAPSHHHVQVFEQWGNRAIYKDGWIACARHTVPWLPDPKTDYFEDRWELYHVAKDFSEAHDVAEQFPEKLKELQALFDVEAMSYNIYPLGGSSYKAPSSTENRREFVFYPSLPRIPPWAAPSFTDSHRITADVVIPAGGAEGVLVTLGTRLGGFSLYVKDNHLVYDCNFYRVEHDVLTSSIPLPQGKVELVYEFTREDSSKLRQGTGRIFINGQKAGEVKTHGPSAEVFGAFNIGQARISPVSSAYTLPFKFTGSIEKVRVKLT